MHESAATQFLDIRTYDLEIPVFKFLRLRYLRQTLFLRPVVILLPRETHSAPRLWLQMINFAGDQPTHLRCSQ